jgi:hypothetical protein
VVAVHAEPIALIGRLVGTADVHHEQRAELGQIGFGKLADREPLITASRRYHVNVLPFMSLLRDLFSHSQLLSILRVTPSSDRSRIFRTENPEGNPELSPS